MINIKLSYKAQTQIITLLLVLFVVTAAGIGTIKWFNEFSSDLANKNIQNPHISSNGIQILGLKYDSNHDINLVVKSRISGYKKIHSIILNNENCSLIGTNVIVSNTIIDIPLECPTIKTINQVKLFTKDNLIEKTSPISSN